MPQEAQSGFFDPWYAPVCRVTRNTRSRADRTLRIIIWPHFCYGPRDLFLRTLIKPFYKFCQVMPRVDYLINPALFPVQVRNCFGDARPRRTDIIGRAPASLSSPGCLSSVLQSTRRTRRVVPCRPNRPKSRSTCRRDQIRQKFGRVGRGCCESKWTGFLELTTTSLSLTS